MDYLYVSYQVPNQPSFSKRVLLLINTFITASSLIPGPYVIRVCKLFLAPRGFLVWTCGMLKCIIGLISCPFV